MSRQDDMDRTLDRMKEPQGAFTWSDYKTEVEVERYQQEENYGYSNISPGSVLVAAIGTTWKPGTWERVVNMVQYARDQDYTTWLDEIPDSLSLPPYEELPIMRQRAVLLAQARGFEWLCIVENDILPEPELLVNLLKRDVAILGPRILDPDHEGGTIGSPHWKPNQGCVPMKFLPFTFLLFRTAVFNCTPQAFIETRLEGDLFLRLWGFGHRPYQDTNNMLEIASAPKYREESEADRLEVMMNADISRRQKPDRRPVDPSTPTLRGIYAPMYGNGAVKEPVK